MKKLLTFALGIFLCAQTFAQVPATALKTAGEIAIGAGKTAKSGIAKIGTTAGKAAPGLIGTADVAKSTENLANEIQQQVPQMFKDGPGEASKGFARTAVDETKIGKAVKEAKTNKKTIPLGTAAAAASDGKAAAQQKKIVVLTLDAGGTGLKFGVVCNGEILDVKTNLDSKAENLEHFLRTMESGFENVMHRVKTQMPDAEIVAISFGFPGPADYPNGIIGKTQNIPAFKERDGVALGPWLADKFGLPVFINNDAANFAIGADAIVRTGLNAELAKRGDPRVYSNTTGYTLGTGFGSGTVLNGNLVLGDTGSAGEVSSAVRSSKHPERPSEEGISKRAVQRVYARESGEKSTDLTPLDIFKIAERKSPGNPAAARVAFKEMGQNLGDVIATVSGGPIDGIAVIGGGLAGSWKYFMPDVMDVLNGSTHSADGVAKDRTVAQFYNMQDPLDVEEFYNYTQRKVKVPGSDKEVAYNSQKKLPIFVLEKGTEDYAQVGAYHFALKKLNLAYIVLPIAGAGAAAQSGN